MPWTFDIYKNNNKKDAIAIRRNRFNYNERHRSTPRFLALSLILSINRKRKYFEKYLAFSQASWAVSAISFVKEMKKSGKKRKYLHLFSC